MMSTAMASAVAATAIDGWYTLVVGFGMSSLALTLAVLIKVGTQTPLVSEAVLPNESTPEGQKHHQLVLRMYDRQVEDGLELTAVTCGSLIDVAIAAGELERVVVFFHKIASLTTPSIHDYMKILRVHAKRRDWHSSLATFRDMEQRGVVVGSGALNVVLATGVSLDQVEDVRDLIVEVGGSRQPRIVDVVSFNTLIKGWAQRADFDQARAAVDQMKASDIQPNTVTYNTAIDAAVRSAKCGDAWLVFEEMLAAKVIPNEATWSLLVESFSESGQAELVPSVLEFLDKVGPECDVASLAEMYRTVLDVASNEMGPDMAVRIFAQMRRHGLSP